VTPARWEKIDAVFEQVANSLLLTSG